MLYLLWDMGFKVGHATRSVNECLRLAKGDITICTALLEARWLWGDQALYRDPRQRFQQDVQAGGATTFIEAKLGQRKERNDSRSEERRVGKECACTCRSLRPHHHINKK